ncbi:MAG: hypothetical protein QW228_03875 [Candidatus Aenigmatarchaeota archaeon]
MKEIVKKILEVVGNEDVVFVGTEDQTGIKTIKTEEIELYPKKFKHVILENFEQLDEDKMKRLVGMADCLWVLFSIDEFVKRIDSKIETMIGKKEFKDMSMMDKIEILKKLSGGEIFIANFNLPEIALAITKEKISERMKLEPFSSFFFNLSIVEYFKSRIIDLEKEKEKLEKELEMERYKIGVLNEKLGRMVEEMERIRREKERIDREKEKLRKKFESDKKEIERRFKRAIVNLLKDKERYEGEMEKMREELKKAIIEIGFKLEEKEMELKRLKEMKT